MISPKSRILRLATPIAVATIATTCLAQMQEKRLTPADPITSDVFGYDVAFDGETILAGAPFGTHSGLGRPGRAYVFSVQAGEWAQQQKLLPSILQTDAFFGNVVTIDGDALAISSPKEDTPTYNAGAVYIFEQIGGVWSETQRLTPAGLPESARFGTSLEMQGNTLMIGAWNDEHAGHAAAGSVYVYQRDIGLGIWTLVDTLHANDPAFNDKFGASISMDGDTALVGAINADHSGEFDAGAVYVFTKEAGVWTQADKLVASDPQSDAIFGTSVAVQNGTAIVGAQDVNSAYLFERANGSWTETSNWTGSGDFGVDVDIDGSTILVGAYLEGLQGRTGVTHVYRKTSGTWNHDMAMVASDLSNTLFGWRIALKGDRAAIGGPFFLTNRGAVYVMEGMGGCVADCDQSTGMGVLDVFDFLCFQSSFVNGDPYACDCDITTGPDVCDVFDFLCFQEAFVGGCP